MRWTRPAPVPAPAATTLLALCGSSLRRSAWRPSPGTSSSTPRTMRAECAAPRGNRASQGRRASAGNPRGLDRLAARRFRHRAAPARRPTRAVPGLRRTRACKTPYIAIRTPFLLAWLLLMLRQSLRHALRLGAEARPPATQLRRSSNTPPLAPPPPEAAAAKAQGDAALEVRARLPQRASFSAAELSLCVASGGACSGVEGGQDGARAERHALSVGALCVWRPNGEAEVVAEGILGRLCVRTSNPALRRVFAAHAPPRDRCVMSYWVAEKSYNKVTTGKWHGNEPRPKGAPKPKPKPTLVKSRVRNRAACLAVCALHWPPRCSG